MTSSPDSGPPTARLDDPSPARRPRRRRNRDPRSQPLYGAYRRFRNLALGGDAPRDAEGLGRHLLAALLEGRGSPIVGARLYRRSGGDFELVAKGGLAGDVETGYRVPADHAVIGEALREGFALVRRNDPRFDVWIERTAGPHALAKLALGAERDVLLSFTLREPFATAEVLNALAALRSLADAALERQQFHQLLEQARGVQTSLLPRLLPALPGFELAVRSRPAEVVGGDVYDARLLGTDSVAIGIADATGHGLPAALQARDVIVGLRMGLEQQMRIVTTIEKLSRLIAEASAGGRYVSLFFAEIDRDGHLIYVNAGHPAPLLLRSRGRRVEALDSSGPILGLEGRAARSWRRRFERLEKGDLLVLYTDGLTEARNPADEELGTERFLDILRRAAALPIDQVVDQVLADVDAFTGRVPQLDDQTLFVVRHK